MAEKLNWPLMDNNITRADLDTVIDFLKGDPILTQSKNVRLFEEEWSKWLGVKYSVFVNSGASANHLTLAVLKYMKGGGEIIVPTLTWVSDISSVILNGFKPVFVDINPKNLNMDEDELIRKITPETRAVFMTYVQGFNGLSDRLLKVLEEKKIPLIEDVCESHGATFKNRRLGSFGWASQFSYYYAHHMSSIEGGMVCTNDEETYQLLRIGRSHGMVREATNEDTRNRLIADNPGCNPEFIFLFPSFNFRNTEIGAVMARNQLPRLDGNVVKRNGHFRLFLEKLDPIKYFTEFDQEGMSNYALNLVIRKADPAFCQRVMTWLKEQNVEFRRGSAGGGNQLRQPFLKGIVPADEHTKYPKVEHIHSYGFYIGNYPDLDPAKILRLCEGLNSIPL